MAYSIEIHIDIDSGELLNSVVHAGEVSCLSVGALLDGQVGNQVGEGVGFDDCDDADIGVFCSKTP